MLLSSAELLIQDDFETGQPSLGWNEVYGGAAHSLSIERGVAHSGQYAARIHYATDESEAKLCLYYLSFEEMYVRFWQMYPAGFNQRNLKQAHLFQASGNSLEGAIILAYWGNTNPAGNQLQTTFYGGFNNPGPDVDWSLFSVPPGEWFKTAFYVKYNTPGQSNGIYRLWRNDVLVTEYTNVVYRSSNEGADGVWVGGNYSGAGVDPVPFDRYLDDIYIAQTPEGDLAPTLTGIEDAALEYATGAAATVITSAITVSDVDSQNLSNATVQITGNFQNGEDVLSFANTGTITGTWNAATGSLLLTGTDTLGNYQAALRAVKYRNTNLQPGTAPRTVTFQVNDGTSGSNLATRQISVVPAESAEIQLELRMVGTLAASDRMSDASFAAYTSITSLPLNSTYYGEVWLRDIGNLRGIAGGSIDLAYATARADVTAIGHGSVYNTLTSGTIDELNGLVDNLGGGTFSTNEGTTQWVRLGTATFKSMGPGAVTYTLGHDLAPGASNASFAEVGAGSLAWNVVQFPAEPLTIEHVPVSVEVFLVPRLAQSAASTSADLPVSERSPFWVLEGGRTAGVNHFFIEVWVRSDQADPAAISGGNVTVSFDPQFARAVAIDHGGVYTLLPIENIDKTTGLAILGGGTLATDKGIQDYALLGRIEFQGNGPVNEVTHRVGPYSLGLGVAAGPNSFAEVGRGNVDATFKPVPAANVKAMMYDIDDSGVVDFGDFSYFVPAFGKTVGVTEPPYTWWADFDASGAVDFGEFSYFVTAFGKAFNSPGIQFPGGGGGAAAAAGGEAKGLAAFPKAAYHPLQNPGLASDVNNRDGVTLVDALLMVNHIDLRGSGPLPTVLPSADNPSVFLDVNGDDAVPTSDMFAVRDNLNGGGRSVVRKGERQSPVMPASWRPAFDAGELATPGVPQVRAVPEAQRGNRAETWAAADSSRLTEQLTRLASHRGSSADWKQSLGSLAQAKAARHEFDSLVDIVLACLGETT